MVTWNEHIASTLIKNTTLGDRGAPTLDGTPCLCFSHKWSWHLFIPLHSMFVRGMRVADKRRLDSESRARSDPK